MADNDKYIIIKENESIKLIGGNTKTRAEYEAVILKTLSEVISDISKEDWNYDIKLAKAVVDRLFGDIR